MPAQVTGLHVANQGTTSSLFTNWTQASGDIDFYQVLLIHENVVIKNESVSSETSRYSFHSLKSGSLYSMVVTTVSGGISSRQVVVEGRTGKKSVCDLWQSEHVEPPGYILGVLKHPKDRPNSDLPKSQVSMLSRQYMLISQEWKLDDGRE